MHEQNPDQTQIFDTWKEPEQIRTPSPLFVVLEQTNMVMKHEVRRWKQFQREEASTHKSAKTNTGNVFVARDLDLK